MRTERLTTAMLLAAILSPLAPLAATAQEAGIQEPSAPGAPAPPSAAAEGESSGLVITGDHTVRAGETVEGLVVVGGDLRIEGEVTGDAVVVGGDLLLEGSGLVHGNAVVTGGQIVENGGRVRGEMRVVSGGSGDIGPSGSEAMIPAVAPAPPHAEGWDVDRQEDTFRGHRGRGWFGSIQRGFAGILSTLAFGLVLAGAGSLLIFYGRRYLDTVSDTIRTSTLRSGGVGIAALFLVVPAFVVLVVALAVSIIGIPLLLVAIPLYPLALAAAAAFGLLATAHALGERTAEQRRDMYDLRYRNSYAYLFTGLGMLLAPLLAADLISMTGFLGFLGTLLKIVTTVIIWIATTVGFGAVILSRFGTQRGFIQPTGTDTPIEPDPFFDGEPSPRGSDV
jgi:hypothetical protein